MRLRFEFHLPGGGSRTLENGDLPARRVFDLDRYVSEAPGGPMDMWGSISKTEYAENAAYYEPGNLVEVWDADDSDGGFPNGRCVWAGRLDTEATDDGATIQLHANGVGKDPDDSYKDRLWQNRDEEAWTAGDADPHNYDQDKLIEARVNGGRLVLGWKRKVKFRRNQAGLPVSWASGLAYWREGKDFSRAAFHIELDRRPAGTELQVLTANGPDGALTLRHTEDLSVGALSRDVNVPNIPGSPDLVYLRLERTAESPDAAKEKAFRCVITNARVNTELVGNTDDYKAHQVVSDVADDYSGDQSGIQASGVNVMPYDAEGISDGDVLDEQALVTNRYWSRRRKADGTGNAWYFEDWGTEEFTFTASEDPVRRVQIEQEEAPRWNVVAVPYRGDGGVRRWVQKRANPDPFPGESFVFRLDLQEPLPPQVISETLGQNVADRLAVARRRVRFSITHVLNELGVEVPATRLREGNVVVFTDFGDFACRIARLECDGTVVSISNETGSGPTGDPVVDRILTRRPLALARGRRNAQATLGGFDVDRPAVPQNVEMGFKEVEVRGGDRRFNAVLDYDPVTEDIDGTGTAIARYVARFRFKDENGNVVNDANGDPMIERREVRRKRGDDAADDLPTKIVLPNLPHPHKWKVQGQVAAVDVFGEPSHFSPWTPAAYPASFAPPAPTNLEVTKHRGKLEADWDRPDNEENDEPGVPSLDRRVAYFIVKKFRNGVQRGKTLKVSSTGKTWRLIKPWTGTWRVDVYSVDRYGNVSAVTSATVGSRKPGKPTNVQTIPKTRGIKGKATPPTAWSDGSTDDWDESEVDTNLWVLKRNGVEVDRVENKAWAVWFPMTKAEAALTGYKVEVESLGHDRDSDGAATDPGLAQTPEALQVGSADIDTGAITYKHYSSSLPGMAAGFYGSPSTTGSPGPPSTLRSFLPGGPTTIDGVAVKTGDQILNLSESPPRLYKYEGSTWYRATEGNDLTAGSLTADKITAGTFQGLAFIGGDFYSASGSDYVSMTNALGAAVSWTRGGGNRGRITGHDTDGLEIRAGVTGLSALIERVRVDSGGLDVVSGTLRQGGTAVSLSGHGHSIAGGTGLHSHNNFTTESSHTHGISNVSDVTRTTSGASAGTAHTHTYQAPPASHGHGGSTGAGSPHGHNFGDATGGGHGHTIS